MGLFKNKKKKKRALRKLAARQEAAGKAYQAAVQFKPVGTTNTFGSTKYTYNPQGQLETAGYTLSPQLQALSQRGISDAGGTGLQFANQATSGGLRLGDLSKQYLATSPEQAAQDYIQSQYALLKPGQDQAYADLQLRLANTGRGGLSVAQGGDLMAANPEAAAYYNALAQRDAALASQADLYGRERIKFGADLQGQGLKLGAAAYAPSQAGLAYSQGVEGLGQDVLNQGLNIGGLRTNAARVGAEGMLNAQSAANQSRYSADKMGNAFSSFLSATGRGLVNSVIGGGGGGSGALSSLGNWASNNYPNSIFGPSMASTQEMYSPQNQGFYGSASQPTYYGGDTSQYSGLSWNRP
jgi:hypothetical protein